MDPIDRINHFKRTFPKSHMCLINGHLEGLWIVGNTYRGSYSGKWYGSYPHSYLERVESLFPDLKAFHLFSGLVEGDWTLDINRNSKAKIIGDAHKLPIKASSLDLIIADPPYTVEDAQKYGTKPLHKIHILQECWNALKPNGFLVWLDLIYPQIHYKDYYNFKLYGIIAIVVSTLHRIRQCTILTKAPLSSRVGSSKSQMVMELEVGPNNR